MPPELSLPLHSVILATAKKERFSMGLIKRGCVHILALSLITLMKMAYGTQQDIACLKEIKDTFNDPFDSLVSWDFISNTTDGFICYFDGIDCWNDHESRVLNIDLAYMKLEGVFPRGLINCTSLTGLDLSFNNLYGEIPSDISKLVPFVTTLVVSSNDFSGEIPRDLSNCTFLNEIQLDDNQLTGQIPTHISSLTRLHAFSVAKNYLDGPIPASIGSRFPAESFGHNEMLCGSPLAPCRPLIRTPHFLAGAAVGAVIFSISCFSIGIYFFIYRLPNTSNEGGVQGNKRLRRTKVSKSKSSLKESEFRELAKATHNFSKEHIVGFGKAKTVTLYRAALNNGNIYTVKRLQYTNRILKECELKMATMGSVRHPNLVPLLGYCVANKELFVVYEHMPNGSLYDHLHSSTSDSIICKCPLTRLKIAVGAANGLAWLHHHCSPRIVHQNISSRSILLGNDFIPKISDFGLATLENQITEHSVKMENGDSGYLAPEHARVRIKTPKRDVYSFGVVLLEIITGEMPSFVEETRTGFNGSLVEWVKKLSENPDLKAAIDRRLVGKDFDEELVKFLEIGCSCVASDPVDRPSMIQVHCLLTTILRSTSNIASS